MHDLQVEMSSTNQTSITSSAPPNLHPLHLLDDLLISHASQVCKDDDIVVEEKIPLLFKGAEFLFGHTGLLEAALSLLDRAQGSGNAPHPVRLIRAKITGRCVILVKGSSSYGEKLGREYLCLLGRRPFSSDQGGSGDVVTASSVPTTFAGRIGFFCNCRSYHHLSRDDPLAVCKHLLAARLASHLDYLGNVGNNDKSRDDDGKFRERKSKYLLQENVEEHEFAKIVSVSMAIHES